MSGKNIVLCSDGTGNTAIKARGTNVFKLYEAVDIQGHKHEPTLKPQVAFYDDGVGTSSSLPGKLIGGAFGLGFAKNVRDLYTDLVHVYEPGDHIYLFGFSRGAYTVRALSGLIQYCGILDAKRVGYELLKQRVDQCWTAFRKEAFKWVPESKRRNSRPTADSSTEDRKRREAYGAIIDDEHTPDGAVIIEFVGVWDTVGAVGMPFEELRELVNWIYPMRFSELTPSSRITRACHALSIDDDRRTFYPELWNEKGIRATQVDQVWFAGVHSNVGGGYVKHGMSLVALDWMMSEAEQCGLRFIKLDRTYAHARQDVHDKLYDARAGLGVYYRWEPRDIAKLCEEHQMVPKIHVSVFERIAQGTGEYAPINIPYVCEVVGTNGKWAWPPEDTLKTINEKATFSSVETGKSLSDTDLRGIVRSGKISYYAFVVASILSVSLSIGWGVVWLWFPEVTNAIVRWCRYPLMVIGGINISVGFVVWGWSRLVDKWMESVAQHHWQDRRRVLREIFMKDWVSPAHPPLAEKKGELTVEAQDAKIVSVKEQEPIPV